MLPLFLGQPNEAFICFQTNQIMFYCLVPTRCDDLDTQAALHIFSHLAHHTGIARHIDQLVVAEFQLKGHVIHREAVVMCCIWVVREGHTLAQGNQNGREEHGQSDLHQRHQNLPLLLMAKDERERQENKRKRERCSQ